MLLIRVGVTVTCHALQGGLALTCPLRCATPKQVVANQTMRQLVARHFPQHRHAASQQPAEARAGRAAAASGLSAMPSRRSIGDRGRSMASESPSLEELPWQTFDRARFERCCFLPRDVRTGALRHPCGRLLLMPERSYRHCHTADPPCGSLH